MVTVFASNLEDFGLADKVALNSNLPAIGRTDSPPRYWL